MLGRMAVLSLFSPRFCDVFLLAVCCLLTRKMQIASSVLVGDKRVSGFWCTRGHSSSAQLVVSYSVLCAECRHNTREVTPWKAASFTAVWPNRRAVQAHEKLALSPRQPGWPDTGAQHVAIWRRCHRLAATSLYSSINPKYSDAQSLMHRSIGHCRHPKIQPWSPASARLVGTP